MAEAAAYGTFTTHYTHKDHRSNSDSRRDMLRNGVNAPGSDNDEHLNKVGKESISQNAGLAFGRRPMEGEVHTPHPHTVCSALATYPLPPPS